MKIAVVVIAVLALALGAAGTVYGVTQASRMAAQAREIRHDETLIRSLSQQQTSLQGKVAGLTVPTDPLSAYSAVCNQAMTNQNTGVTQTFWFPCTNNAQTIPQPSN
jgi:hypothetical protein